MKSSQYPKAAWVPVGFSPAPIGWRAVYVLGAGQSYSVPVPGWELQERWFESHEFADPEPSGDEPVGNRMRQVVPTIMGERQYVMAADLEPGFWQVLGPGELDPTSEEIAEEIKFRAAHGISA